MFLVPDAVVLDLPPALPRSQITRATLFLLQHLWLSRPGLLSSQLTLDSAHQCGLRRAVPYHAPLRADDRNDKELLGLADGIRPGRTPSSQDN